jgi:hypothetical protein
MAWSLGVKCLENYLCPVEFFQPWRQVSLSHAYKTCLLSYTTLKHYKFEIYALWEASI